MRQPTEPDRPALPGSVRPDHHPGLTKREYFAAMALHGLLANPNSDPGDAFGRAAVDLADDLIATLNERSR